MKEKLISRGGALTSYETATIRLVLWLTPASDGWVSSESIWTCWLILRVHCISISIQRNKVESKPHCPSCDFDSAARRSVTIDSAALSGTAQSPSTLLRGPSFFTHPDPLFKEMESTTPKIKNTLFWLTLSIRPNKTNPTNLPNPSVTWKPFV